MVIKIIILKYPWDTPLLIVSTLTQNSEEYKSISISEAVVISWTIAICWLTNIKPHSHANTGMIYHFLLPHFKSQCSIFFQHIEWKDPLQLLFLNWLQWFTAKKPSPHTFPAHNFSNTAEVFIVLL